MIDKFLISVVCLLALVSCDSILEDDLGLKDYPDQTVINASLRADGTAKVFISTSTNILGNSQLNTVNDASVTLFHQGNPIELLHLENGVYGSHEMIRTESTYELVVEIPNKPKISGAARTPGSFAISSVTGIDTLYISKNGDPISSFQLQWNDNPEEENYYEVLLYQLDSAKQPVMLNLRSNNLSISNNTGSDVFGNDANTYNTKALITDVLFNGKAFNLQGQFIKALPQSEVIVHVKSLMPEYYRYLYIQHQALEGQDELFTEPVTTPTNIEGAYGFMGGYYLIEEAI